MTSYCSVYTHYAFNMYATHAQTCILEQSVTHVHDYVVLGESSRLPRILALDGGKSRTHQNKRHKVTTTLSSSRAQGENKY